MVAWESCALFFHWLSVSSEAFLNLKMDGTPFSLLTMVHRITYRPLLNSSDGVPYIEINELSHFEAWRIQALCHQNSLTVKNYRHKILCKIVSKNDCDEEIIGKNENEPSTIIENENELLLARF